MSYTISIYCPDQHISYNINTLNHVGVGGGITARVRIAHALARQGNKVQLFVNCPMNEHLSGVEYIHFSELHHLDTDIFIATTSGDGLNLSGLLVNSIKARLKILLTHGDPKPAGFDQLHFDYIYAPSNFIASRIIEDWKLAPDKLFVTYRGVEESLFNQNLDFPDDRDEYRLIYAGHPSKGLDTAMTVLEILYKNDQRFSLHIFGGYALWGENKSLNLEEPGVVFHGLLGQKALARQMLRSGFSLNLQSRPEPFGMVITESMRAGCIVIASPVGAYSELIDHGVNGFFIPGNHAQAETRAKTAALILDLIRSSAKIQQVRREAAQTPLPWDVVAKTWQAHWDRNIHPGQAAPVDERRQYNTCKQCSGSTLSLADGVHCIKCGYYHPMG